MMDVVLIQCFTGDASMRAEFARFFRDDQNEPRRSPRYESIPEVEVEGEACNELTPRST